MPIDFSRIAADWAAAFRARQLVAGRALALIGPWLAERLERLEALDRRSRRWPTYAFEGRALSVRLAPSQRGLIRPYGSTGAAVAAPFVAFGRGFVRVGQAVEDEWVLPGVLSAVERVVRAILDSIERWRTPRAAMFDPRQARASDLFGMSAMAWRGLAGSLPQLRRAATDIRAELQRWLSPPRRAAGEGALPATPEGPTGSTGASLERYIVAAILVLPALPGWIEGLARAAWLTARLKVLDLVQSIEARVFSLRATVLRTILVDVPAAVREVPAVAAALGAMLSWNIRYFARLAQVWMDLIVFALRLFLRAIDAVANAVISLINGFLRLIQTIMQYDLLTFIKPLLGPAGLLIDAIGMRLSLDDLIEAGTQAVNLTVYANLKAAIAAARAGIIASGTQIPLVGRGLIPSGTQAMLLHKLSLIEQVVDALFANTGGPMVETAAPVVTGMPNFYDLLVGAPPAEVAGHLRTFGSAMADHFAALLDQVSTSLQGLARVFDRTAADLARTGPAERMAAFGRDTSELVGGLYDDQIRGLGQRIAERRPGSFERWLIGGGFHVIGAVIPQYVRSMLRWWEDEDARGEGPAAHVTPTSPHILARHARLGRVHLPRLTLRAGGRAHDEALVRELAAAFRTAVQDAYREGERRLEALRPAAAS